MAPAVEAMMVLSAVAGWVVMIVVLVIFAGWILYVRWHRRRDAGPQDSEWFVVSPDRVGFCSLSFRYREFRELRESGACKRLLDAMRAAYEDVWPQWQRIYGVDTELYLQMIPVHWLPIHHEGVDKPIVAYPDRHMVVMQWLSPGPRGTEFDLSPWVAELHNIFKWHSFGAASVYNMEIPSREQCEAAIEVVRPYWWSD